MAHRIIAKYSRVWTFITALHIVQTYRAGGSGSHRLRHIRTVHKVPEREQRRTASGTFSTFFLSTVKIFSFECFAVAYIYIIYILQNVLRVIIQIICVAVYDIVTYASVLWYPIQSILSCLYNTELCYVCMCAASEC